MHYGRVSGLRALASALQFVERFPGYIVNSPVAVAAILSIGVALGANAQDIGAGDNERGQQAERFPVHNMLGAEHARQVRAYEAHLIMVAFRPAVRP